MRFVRYIVLSNIIFLQKIKSHKENIDEDRGNRYRICRSGYRSLPV